VLDFLFPERVANRLVLRVTDLLDDPASLPLSFWARNELTDRLDAIAEADGYTPVAKDTAMYATYVGYAVRLVEETDRKARPLDRSLASRLDHVRAAAPGERRLQLETAIADPETPDHQRQMFQRWLDRDDKNLEFEQGHQAVIETLIDDSIGESRWIDDDRRFLKLTGYSPNVWRIFVLKLTETLNERLHSAGDRAFPWEAIQELARLGYLLRVGDALSEERWVPPSPR
jgi:hypothetical protein